MKKYKELLIIGLGILIFLFIGIVIYLNFFIKDDSKTLKKETTTLKAVVTTTSDVQNFSSSVMTKAKVTTNKKTLKVKKTTTKNDTTIKFEKTTRVINSSERLVEDYKYGVKKISDIEYETIIYEDGTEKKNEKGAFITYDTKGFNATTADLKAEAQELVIKNNSIYHEIVNNVNIYRSEVGKPSLQLDADLSLAATIRALEIAWSSKYSHTRPDGSDCLTVYNDLGYVYSAAGENIAKGFSSAESVSNGWYNSKGHYENMISDYFGRIGIGHARANSTDYWVQMFAN